MKVIGISGIRGSGEGGVEGLADEGEELTDVVEDVMGGAREEETVVGRDEGDAVGETVGCDAGRRTSDVNQQQCRNDDIYTRSSYP